MNFRKLINGRLTYFILLFIILFSSTVEAKTIRINKPRIVADLSKGESTVVEIQVVNPTEEPSAIKVYPEDWEYDASGNGDKSFYPPGTFEISASQWLTYAPEQFTLAPFGEQTVSLTIKVPDDLPKEGTYYSLLFFETTLGETVNEQGAAVQVAGRVGALIYVNVAGTVIRSGIVNDIQIKAGDGNKPTNFSVTFTNTGNTYIPLESEFIVFDSEGLVKGRGELSTMYTREGMRVTRETQWPTKLTPGVYDFVFTFNLGEGEALVEERQFTVE